MEQDSWSIDELWHLAKNRQFSSKLGARRPEMHPRNMDGVDPAKLTTILDRAGEHRSFLTRLFTASGLLGGAPDDVWAFLGGADGPPLDQWRGAVWRLAWVPCVLEGRAALRSILCGWSASPLSDGSSTGLEPQTQEALCLARLLAETKWNGHGACWHWSETSVDGPSFGLPVFLALGCAAAGLETPELLATGRIEARDGQPTGRIGRVDGVAVKARLAGGGCLLAPKEGFAARDMPSEALPVGTAVEAWNFWQGCAQGAHPRILNELRATDQIGRFLSLLRTCSAPELDHAMKKPHRIRASIWRHPDEALPELRQLIKHINQPGVATGGHVGAVLRTLIPAQDIHKAAEAGHPKTAWHLCMLHIRALNHSGDPGKAQNLLECSRAWERDLGAEDGPDEFIGHTLTIVGLQHNRYAFGEDPERMCPWQVTDMIEAAEKRLRRGQADNKPLGDWYGTLGQHHAYAGNFDRARDYLDKARLCFTSPADEKQNLSYRFFLSLQAQDREMAETLLAALLPEGIAAALATSGPWKLFPALRFLRDIGHEGHGEALHALGEDLLRQPLQVKHPWQLVLYNLGLLTDEAALQAALLRASARICGHRKTGPTVRVMALLPLAALRRLGLPMPGNARDRVEAIRRLIPAAGLDTAHFAPILTASSWQAALDATTRHEARLFPFNYR